jgi:hypothetical protein
MTLEWKLLFIPILIIIILTLLKKYYSEGFQSLPNLTGYVMSGDDIDGTIAIQHVITVSIPGRSKEEKPRIIQGFLAQNDDRIAGVLIGDDKKENGGSIEGKLIGVKNSVNPQSARPGKYSVTKQRSYSSIKNLSKLKTGYTITGEDITAPVARIIDFKQGKIYLAQYKDRIIGLGKDREGKQFPNTVSVKGNILGGFNSVDLSDLNTNGKYTLKKD